MHACQPWASRVGAWFDGEVSELEAVEVRAHLMDCAGCRAAVAEWRALRQDLGLLQPAAPAEEVLVRMARRFEAGLAGEVHAVARALRVWTVAAALLLALGLGWLAGDVAASQQRDIDRAVQEILDRPAVGAAD
jgi:anti-sigma factor RsiW